MKRLLALAALVVLAAAACTYGGTPADPAALTIDGDVVVSVAQLEDELAFLADDAAMATALLGDPSALDGEVPGAYSPVAAATLLNLHAQMALLASTADAEGVEVTQDDLDAARSELQGQLQGIGVEIDDLPVTMVDALVAGQAANVALRTWAQENQAEITDDDVQAFFDERAGGLGDEVVCARHILVAFPGEQGAEPTDEDVAAARAEIEAAAERLAGGEDFAALADELSDDPGSGALGGDLGCGNPERYVAEFAEAVTTQPVGEVGDPVVTDFGIHLVEVTYRGEPTAELFEDEIRQALAQERPDPAAQVAALVEERALDADVVLDPRYGTWDDDTVSVLPPEGAASPPTSTPSLEELLGSEPALP